MSDKFREVQIIQEASEEIGMMKGFVVGVVVTSSFWALALVIVGVV